MAIKSYGTITGASKSYGTTTDLLGTPGFVVHDGTASLTVSPTTTATGRETLLATAALVVSPAPVAALGAVTKTSSATAVTISPTTAAAGFVTSMRAATGVTVTRTTTASGESWMTQFYQPDAILVMSGLTGTVSEIQDSPNSPDANGLDPTGGAIDLRFSFENHSQLLRANANDQTVRVRVTAV